LFFTQTLVWHLFTVKMIFVAVSCPAEHLTYTFLLVKTLRGYAVIYYGLSAYSGSGLRSFYPRQIMRPKDSSCNNLLWRGVHKY
jgi:hypothetical protein